jgi:hypothetical protein
LKNLEEIKEQLSSLVLSGRKDEAIKLLREKFNVTLEEAEKLLGVALRESITPAKFFTGVIKGLGGRISDSKGGSGCRQTILKLLAVVFGFFGIPALLIAIGVYVYYDYQIDKSIIVTGTVVEVKPYRGYNDPIEYIPVIDYTVDGKTYSMKAPIHSSTPEFEEGERVDLFVNREDPESVIIDTFTQRWLIITVIGSVGLIFTMMMVAFIVMGRKS